jgi:integrase
VTIFFGEIYALLRIMTPTINIELDHKTNRFHTNRIYLRFSFQGRNHRLGTDIHVVKKNFNKKGTDRKWIRAAEIDSDYKNQKLYKLKREYERKLDDYFQFHDYFNWDTFIAKPKKVKKKCYFQYAYEEYQTLIEDDKIGTSKKRRSKHNQFAEFYNNKRLNEFWDSKKLPFNEIDVAMLVRYKKWLIKEGKLPNTVIGSLKSIRTMYNQAINDNIIPYGNSPFINNRFRVGAMKASRKEKLTKEELSSLMEVNPVTEREQNAQNYFLFSFFTFGMRASDVFLLKWKDINGDRLNYSMSKNGKVVPEIKLSNHALTIIKQYEGRDNTYVFPPFYGYGSQKLTNKERDRVKDGGLVYVNKALKTLARKAKIEKNISMHVSRHSFANISKDQGVPVEVLKEQLCHSDIKITYEYLASFNNKTLQDAGDTVYELF